MSKFLVVDDEFISLSKLRHLLSRYGEVDVAECGRTAMEMFHRALEEALQSLGLSIATETCTE